MALSSAQIFPTTGVQKEEEGDWKLITLMD
jgi:hypothetical protein